MGSEKEVTRGRIKHAYVDRVRKWNRTSVLVSRISLVLDEYIPFSSRWSRSSEGRSCFISLVHSSREASETLSEQAIYRTNYHNTSRTLTPSSSTDQSTAFVGQAVGRV